MKKTFFILLFFTMIFAGCSDMKEEGVDTAKKVMEISNKAAVISDLIKIRIEINLYYVQKGYFPKSIEELNLNLNNPMTDFIYDQLNGTVKHKDYSQL